MITQLNARLKRTEEKLQDENGGAGRADEPTEECRAGDPRQSAAITEQKGFRKFKVSQH